MTTPQPTERNCKNTHHEMCISGNCKCYCHGEELNVQMAPHPTEKDLCVYCKMGHEETCRGTDCIEVNKLLAAQRLETRDAIIQILNDYPYITVGDLERIKNEIYDKFPDALLAKLEKEDKYK